MEEEFIVCMCERVIITETSILFSWAINVTIVQYEVCDMYFLVCCESWRRC